MKAPPTNEPVLAACPPFAVTMCLPNHFRPRYNIIPDNLQKNL